MGDRKRAKAKPFIMPVTSELRRRYDYKDGVLYHKLDHHGGFLGKAVGGWTNSHGRKIAEIRNNGAIGKLTMYKLILAWHGVSIPCDHVVHHLNMDCSDNRIENLGIWPSAFHEGYHGGLLKRPACYGIIMNNAKRIADSCTCIGYAVRDAVIRIV